MALDDVLKFLGSSSSGEPAPTAPPQPGAQFVPGQGGLSSDWQKFLASPFARDTLLPLIGSHDLAVRSSLPPAGRPDLAGHTSALGDTVSMYLKPGEDYFTHEIGHVIDVRDLAPEVSGNVAAIYTKLKPRFGYAGTNEYEYIAETFRTAMNLFRSTPDLDQRNERLKDVERVMPGVKLWSDWLHKQFGPKTQTDTDNRLGTATP